MSNFNVRRSNLFKHMDAKLDKLFKKASNKHKAGKLADAVILYKKLLRTDKMHLDANYMLGTLYAEQGKTEDALKYLSIAQNINPGSPYVQNNLGNVYRTTNQYDLAITHYQNALSIKADMAEACNNLGIALKQTGKQEQAVQFYERAIAIKPDFTDAYYNLASFYWDNEDYERAYPLFLHIIEINPDHARTYDRLGSYYLKQGNNEKATVHFNSYLKLVTVDECGVRMKLAYINGNDNVNEIPDSMPQQLVKETYEKKASNWDQNINRSGMEFLGPQLIRNAFDKLYKEQYQLNILDLGCGTGLCGEYLHHHAQNLIGIDLSQHMLDVANQKDWYTQLVNQDIIEYLSMSELSFDLVTASGVVIFFGDLQPLFQHVKSILTPQGHFIFTLYKSNDKEVEVRENIHFAHSAEYMQNIASENDFIVESVEQITHEYDYGKEQPGLLVVLKNNI